MMPSAIRDIMYGTVEHSCTSEIVAKLASHCKEVDIFSCSPKGKCIYSIGYSSLVLSCKLCIPLQVL
ncbi:hypothetical protein M6B38_404470 [Iris pallida]|uniref:Uncharacterized protein n=1 Tax=Iris pallida TaxID=29817 RepID=A0AAX6FRU9_IRIPA|nr:hypothetical protein M6B38_404470 [Iris pallida]